MNTRIIVIDEREKLKISLLMQNLFLPREIHRFRKFVMGSV